MNQVVGNLMGAVLFFIVWAALITWMWEAHWMAGLIWTAIPVAVGSVVAMKYLKS